MINNTNDKQEKLHIAHAMDIYLPTVDGVVQCMHQYCTNLSKEHDVTALVPKNEKNYVDNFPYKVIRCKSTYIPIAKYYYGNPSGDAKFKKKVDECNFDIIHVHSPFKMAKFAISYAKKHNIPIVATFHTNFRPIFNDIFKSPAITESILTNFGNVYNKMDEIFVCSEGVAKQARSFGYKGKITLLPFGTEFEKCDNVEALKNEANQKLGLDPNELVFIFVGRVMPLKRIDFILESLKILKEKGVSFKFYVVGKGMYLDKLKKLTSILNLEENVVFMGFVDREMFPLLYARADLLLFPSIYDNFGLVKVEAAAFSTAGVYVKNTQAGSGILDKHNGFISEDNPQDFANTIYDAIQDREKLNEIGINASNEIYYNWKDCTDKLVEQYRRIINEKKEKLSEKGKKEKLKNTKPAVILRARRIENNKEKLQRKESRQYMKQENLQFANAKSFVKKTEQKIKKYQIKEK